MILKLSDFFAQKKNKKWLYVILIIAVIMLFISSLPKTEKEEAKSTELPDFEQRLEKTLSKMAGVGKTEVIVNYKKTAEKVLAKNITEDKERKEEEVVFSNSGEVILYETTPELLGVVVICEGGASSSVKVNVIKAVSALTGLSAKCIGVFKGV